MSSAGSVERFRLDRDLPTTPADVAVLRRLRRPDPMPLRDYLEFLAAFPPPTPEVLRSRRAPAGAPFDLLRTAG